MLSFSYYLHERAEESRHNETMGFLIAVLGSIFMVSGIIQTLLTVQRPQWFLIFPYQIGSSPYDILGLAFTLLGLVIFLAGIVLAYYYAAQRIWYSNALKEAYRFEEEKLRAQKRAQKEDNFQIPPPLGASEGAPFPDIPDFKPNVDQQSAKPQA